jgi:hypothetical protein
MSLLDKSNSVQVSVDEFQQVRPFGMCAGEFIVPDDFDAPLPETILQEFEAR